MNRRLGYLRDLCRAARKYRLSPFEALSRFYRLSVPEQFSPNEILRLGLLDSQNMFTVMSRGISKEALLRIQTRINPGDHVHRTEDKLDFYAFCMANGLPMPRLHAVYSRSDRKIGAVPVIATCDEVEAFLTDHVPGELVIKPADGTHGEGVLVLSRQPDGLWDDGDRTLSASGICRRMTDSPFVDWIVQERLFSAEALRELAGTSLLQTARVVTLANGDGSCDVLLAWLRITAGPARTDNFNFGASGNVVAPIDVRTGRLGVAARMSPDGLGLEPVAAHPRSERLIEGFCVPDWEGVLALARKGGACFLPLQTVGWDIAITDRHPVLIEGNANWDPLPANPDLTLALRRLQSASALQAQTVAAFAAVS